MEVGTQIKKYRTKMNISQEDLAERIYVTRQTISNWENSKSYPDIHSLLLLSSIFNVSLDQLIKGDIEFMREEIDKEQIQKFNQYGKIYTVLFILSILSFAPLIIFLKIYGGILWALLYAITLFFAVKVEKVKKENNVHTYKEIVAFCDGKRLDEIHELQENAKRPYQKILLVLGSAVITFIVCILIGLCLHFLKII